MKQLNNPLYAVAACVIGALLLVIGVITHSPGMMKIATAFLGLVALALAAIRFAAVQSLTTLLLGVVALWMVLGKWIMSMATQPLVEKQIIGRVTAENWESYVVLSGALLLLTLALLASPRGADAKSAEEPEATDS